MPVVYWRQPWFWAIIVAAIAVLTFAMVIAASGPNRNPQENNVVVQQPSSAPSTQAAPIAVPVTPPSPSAAPAPPAPPAPPSPPMPAAQPPQVIHEKTVIVKSNEAEKRKADEARKQADQAKRRADDARRKAESQTSKRDEDTSSTPRAPSDKGREPVVAKDVFQNTGLAREIHYDSARWKATRTVTVDPERKLTEVGSADEGMSLMVSENATEPYKTILIAVPDEDGKYVEYRRQ